ncbi:outer membrane beta-barrel family protein [Lacihabitans soyangensis]|uniref:TonB-dependent receptor n=1 Tax=Lacihabitans soyangensis TaxID=869394 RepID=A0AAE3GZN9_9BACT|nr:outer membrane beta-barrel family protein [Lacihabitans soyangensis]MCP9762227.1 TonB-dependent receptor [Lacihabitans soyangensis]
MKKILLTVLIGLGFNAAFAQWGPPGGGGGMGRPGGGSENGRPGANTQKPATLDLEANVPKGNSKISGNVVDDAVTTAVEFANIALINIETKKPVDGTMADEKGFFSMKKVAAGTYNIQVSFIGFDTKIIEKVVVEKGKDVELGVIKLKQSTKQLDELVVSGQAAMIEEKVDRLVYNAEKDLSAKGGDASDILKNVPMLSVDLEGNVSLRGSENIRVLINNKPSTIVASSIADALKMIPADIIKSVEVITSPSAKYDAEGSAGIINIITKKSSLQGLNLNIDSGVGLRGSNLGLNGNFRKGKLGITLGGFGRAFYNKSAGETSQLLKSTGVSTEQNQDGNHFGMFGRYNIGLDYELAKNQSLSGTLAFGIRSFDRDQVLNSSSFLNGSLLNSSIRDISSIDRSNSMDANIDYIRTFKPGQEWSVSTQFSQNKLVNNFDSDLLSISNEILSRQKNINDNLNTEITLQSDYVSPIGKKQQIEFGAKGVFRTVESDFEYLLANPTGNFSSDARNPSGYLNYSQNVMAAYASYLFTTKKKFNFKVGARYEYTEITADDSRGAIEIPAYSNLVPSFNVSKSIKATTYKLGYNRRIQRPGLQQLNPNVNLVNPLSISYGNSSLNPELTDNVEFSISKSIKKSYLTVSLFARQSNNSITRVSFASDSIPGAIVTTFENIGKEQTLGTNVFGNVILSSNWTLNGGVDMYYRYLEGFQTGLTGLSEKVSNDGIILSGRLMSNLKLKKGWAMQAGGGMRGNNINLQGRQGGMGMYSLGVRKDFGKKASLGLAAENFFGGMIMRNSTDTPVIFQKSVNYMYNSNIKATFSYKIGNMRFVADKKKVKNDDVKSGGEEN